MTRTAKASGTEDLVAEHQGPDLRSLLAGSQQKLLTTLQVDVDAFTHPTAKGDAAEEPWRRVIEAFLPARYSVKKAFVIDSDGRRSQQLDLVIFDRHFCPLLFEAAGGDIYIPAESVFAVFEVRQELSRENMAYAADKVASVRALHRTSVPIVDRGVVKPAREPFHILGGILTSRSSWSPPFGDALTQVVAELASTPEAAQRLDIGCALEHGAFEIETSLVTAAAGGGAADEVAPGIDVLEGGEALMFLLLRLYGRLQQIGSPMAIDMHAYSRALKPRRLPLALTNGGGR